MANAKVGSLIYDIVADTSQFQQGLIKSRGELADLKKLFLQSRTPLERLGMEMQRMSRIFEAGGRPVNMISRNILELAEKTKGGIRETQRYASEIKKQAEAMNLELQASRNSTFAQREKLKSLRELHAELTKGVALHHENAQAQRQAEIDKSNTARRQAEIAKRQNQEASASASRLSRVKSLIEQTIPPQRKLVRSLSEARQELVNGNISAEQFKSIQALIVAEAKKLNPIYAEQERKQKEIADALAKRLQHEKRITEENEKRQRAKLNDAKQRGRDTADQAEAARLARVRGELEALITPQAKLAARMADVRTEFNRGKISAEQYRKIQNRLKLELKQLQAEADGSAARLRRVKDMVAASVPAADRLERQMHELKMEFEAGNVSAKQYEQTLKRLMTEYQNLGPKTNSFGKQLAAIGKHIGVITAGYTALGQVRDAFSKALELGRAQKQFEIFTGSLGTAKHLIAELRQIAAKTPLTFDSGQQATKTLLQYGVASSEVVTILKQLGDVSGGSRETLQRLALAFGQISANTRLQGQELRQLVEAGFNPLQVISEKTGESMLDLRVRMSDGAISIDEVKEALAEATGEAGRFNNALQRVGEETAFGQIERLKGELDLLKTDLAIGAAEASGEAAQAATKGIAEVRKAAKALAQQEKSLATNVLFTSFVKTQGSGVSLLGTAFEFLVEAERAAIVEAEKLNDELTEVANIDPGQKFLESEAGENLINRIKELRTEQQKLNMSSIQYELLMAKKAGATDPLLQQLRKELELVEKIKKKQEETEELEKKRSKELKDRKKEQEKLMQENKRFAEQVKDSIKSPLEKLVEEIKAINSLAPFLLSVEEKREAIREKMMDFAEKQAKEAEKSRIDPELAPAVRSGSREEFKAIASIARGRANAELKRHQEAQEKRQAFIAAINAVKTAIVDEVPRAIADLIPEGVE